MGHTLEIPLDIPDVTIESVRTNPAGHLEITVKSTVEGTPCHRCGQQTTQVYGEEREITLRHLSILGRQTYIRLRPRRYQCPLCEGRPPPTQVLTWYTPRSASTWASEEQVLLSLVNSTVQDVALKEAVGYEAILGMLDRHIAHAIKRNGVDIFLILIYGIINGLVLLNAILHDPEIGYDASAHLKYIQTLSELRLPAHTDTQEFFSPPLPYLIPALLQSLTNMELFWAKQQKIREIQWF